MSGTDRLAALRAQKQHDGLAPRPAPVEDYEMSPVGTTSTAVNGNGANDSFLDEISAIQGMIAQFTGNVSRISELQSRALNVVGGAGEQSTALLDDQITQTRDLSSQIKKRIEILKRQGIRRGQESHKDQITLVMNQFVSALQNYTTVERDYRQKQRQRVERQFKIVKPDATEEEIAAVLDNSKGSGDQIFAQAMTTTTRYGESRQAYQEVQSRHEDIRKIEETLAEVAQLMGDMAVLVAQQDEVITYVDDTATDIEKQTKKGVEHTDAAVKHARRARKKRIILFFLLVIVLLIIAGIVAGVVVTKTKH